MVDSVIADTSGQDERIEVEPNHRQKFLRGSAVAVVVVLLAYFVWPYLTKWSEAGISVPRERQRFATVMQGDFVRDVSVQGRVVAAVSPTLYASQTGTITFLVEAGDSVRAGDVLASIESPEIENQLKQEEANLARLSIEVERNRIQQKQEKLANKKAVDLAQVSLTAADREARRADQAYEKEAISQLDFEKAHDERASARLAHEHAVADAALAEERLNFELRTRELELDRQELLVSDLARQVDELEIRSPVDGIVGNLLVDQKTAVIRNLAVMAVVDLTRFEIEAQVPESYADDLAVGMMANVRAGSNDHAATLVAVSPEIISSQVTVRLRFRDGSPVGLRQNQRLTTRVLLEERNDVLKVSRGQFLESGGGRFAYRVSDDIARRTPIVVGARSLNEVEIVSGLEIGDTIVVSSTESFENNDSVLLTN